MMKKYRIREGSIAANAIMILIGLALGPGLVALAIF